MHDETWGLVEKEIRLFLSGLAPTRDGHACSVADRAGLERALATLETLREYAVSLEKNNGLVAAIGEIMAGEPAAKVIADSEAAAIIEAYRQQVAALSQDILDRQYSALIVEHVALREHSATIIRERDEARKWKTTLQSDMAFQSAQARIAQLEGALRSVLVMWNQGPCPRKLDEALSWRQNDEKARQMADAALSPATAEPPTPAVELSHCDHSGRCVAPASATDGTTSCVYCGKELHFRDGNWWTWDARFAPNGGIPQEQESMRPAEPTPQSDVTLPECEHCGAPKDSAEDECAYCRPLTPSEREEVIAATEHAARYLPSPGNHPICTPVHVAWLQRLVEIHGKLTATPEPQP